MALQRLNEQESIYRSPQSPLGCMSEIVMYFVLPLLTEDRIFENSTNRMLLVRISVVAFLTVRKRQAQHLQYYRISKVYIWIMSIGMPYQLYGAMNRFQFP